MEAYIKKQELNDILEERVCKWCGFYNHGEWSQRCRICNVSVCFQCVALATEHLFNPDDEIGNQAPDLTDDPK